MLKDWTSHISYQNLISDSVALLNESELKQLARYSKDSKPKGKAPGKNKKFPNRHPEIRGIIYPSLTLMGIGENLQSNITIFISF